MKNVLIFQKSVGSSCCQFPHSFVDPLLGGNSFVIKYTAITWCKQTGKVAALVYYTMVKDSKFRFKCWFQLVSLYTFCVHWHILIMQSMCMTCCFNKSKMIIYFLGIFSHTENPDNGVRSWALNCK